MKSMDQRRKNYYSTFVLLHPKSPHDHHSPAAIRKRLEDNLKKDNYLGDFVLGAIDGAVTTFAMVAGVAGAGLPKEVALVLGLANLVADGFSMAASNYQKSQSDAELIVQTRLIEEEHIDTVPHGEMEEVRQIYAKKGLEGELLEDVVRVITADRQRWIDTMIMEEFGMQLRSPSPLKSALVTFLAFVLVGAVPLLPFVLLFKIPLEHVFAGSVLATALAFFAVGSVKGRLVHKNWIFSGLETLLIGGAAAAMAYFVGSVFKGILV